MTTVAVVQEQRFPSPSSLVGHKVVGFGLFFTHVVFSQLPTHAGGSIWNRQTGRHGGDASVWEKTRSRRKMVLEKGACDIRRTKKGPFARKNWQRAKKSHVVHGSRKNFGSQRKWRDWCRKEQATIHSRGARYHHSRATKQRQPRATRERERESTNRWIDRLTVWQNVRPSGWLVNRPTDWTSKPTSKWE